MSNTEKNLKSIDEFSRREKQFAALVKNKSFTRTMSKLGEDIVFIPGDEWTEKIKKQYVEYGEVIKSIAAEEKGKKK